jgi:hypothetical protein
MFRIKKKLNTTGVTVCSPSVSFQPVSSQLAAFSVIILCNHRIRLSIRGKSETSLTPGCRLHSADKLAPRWPMVKYKKYTKHIQSDF